jgi:hypothetical protein
MDAINAIGHLASSEVSYCVVALANNLSMAPNCCTVLASPEAGNGVDIVRALVKGLGGPLLITQVTY